MTSKNMNKRTLKGRNYRGLKGRNAHMAFNSAMYFISSFDSKYHTHKDPKYNENTKDNVANYMENGLRNKYNSFHPKYKYSKGFTPFNGKYMEMLLNDVVNGSPRIHDYAIKNGANRAKVSNSIKRSMSYAQKLNNIHHAQRSFHTYAKYNSKKPLNKEQNKLANDAIGFANISHATVKPQNRHLVNVAVLKGVTKYTQYNGKNFKKLADKINQINPESNKYDVKTENNRAKKIDANNAKYEEYRATQSNLQIKHDATGIVQKGTSHNPTTQNVLNAEHVVNKANAKRNANKEFDGDFDGDTKIANNNNAIENAFKKATKQSSAAPTKSAKANQMRRSKSAGNDLQA